MGYMEYVCQLCGVSFAIGRYRRPDEDISAGWKSYGAKSYIEINDLLPEDCFKNGGGCKATKHGQPKDSRSPKEGVEHVAGLGCVGTSGYSGHRISLEEMKGCRDVQCLFPKYRLESWEPEEGDEDFEEEADCFLTGIGEGSPDEAPLRPLDHARHNVTEVFLSNGPDIRDFVPWGLPFHPSCFAIFKHASYRRSGHVDADGLWEWRNVEGSYKDFFYRFPRHPAVRHCSAQFWDHTIGTEWLVANPVELPGFPQLLSELRLLDSTLAYQEKALYTYGGRGFSPVPPHQTIRQKDATSELDSFEKLPREILDLVLELLSPKDIVNLRLVTRAAELFPTSLFRGLIADEMPWFWEIHDLPPDTLWSRLYFCLKFIWWDMRGLKKRRQVWKDVEYILNRIDVLRSEGILERSKLAQDLQPVMRIEDVVQVADDLDPFAR